jgi:hypothetical protein
MDGVFINQEFATILTAVGDEAWQGQTGMNKFTMKGCQDCPHAGRIQHV